MACLVGWGGPAFSALVDVRVERANREAIVQDVRYRSGRDHDYAWLYHTFGGRARPSGCPSHPSCSRYGPLAREKHGGVGVLMMVDRFLREHQDMRSRKWTALEGGEKVYDPVEDNDYWFHEVDASMPFSVYYWRELVREWTGRVRLPRRP